MNTLLIKISVPLVGLGVAVVALLIGYVFLQAWWSQPPAVFGCQFCHRTVSTDEAASIPAVQQCLFCHDFGKIDGSLSASATAEGEIAKIRAAFYGSDDGAPPAAVDWARVHRLPDHVQFVHSPHITAGLSCSTCHGNVAEMEVVNQVRNLKMRDCVDCHRDLNAPTDCATCHY